MSPVVRDRAARSRRTGSTDDPHERGLELLEGVGARQQLGREPGVGASDAPARSAGTSRPVRATTSHTRSARPRRRSGRRTPSPPDARSPAVTDAVRPKKSGASASVNARSPRYGLRSMSSVDAVPAGRDEGESVARAASANATAPTPSEPTASIDQLRERSRRVAAEQPPYEEPTRWTSSACDGVPPAPIGNPVR